MSKQTDLINIPDAITVSGSNVGIGTSSPSFEAGSGGGLEVNYSAGLGSHIKLTDSASGAGGSNGFDLYAFNTSGYIENYEAGSIIFRNGGDQRMAIDSSGRVTMPYQPYFAAEMNGVNNYVSSGADTNLPFNSAPYNVGGHFNASTYRFTAPVTGKYAMAVGVINDVSSPVGRFMFYVNNSADGNGVKWGINGSSTAGGGSTTASAVIWLNANDYVEVRSQSGAIVNYQGNHSSWTGILVS
jgi:hypothetical protein